MEALLHWFTPNARALPWRTRAAGRDPYAIWISEIMLQQTQVKTVIPYFERWMRELPTVHALAKSRPERILKLWESLGYYTRARNLQQAAQIIVQKHAGRFPDRFDEMLALPGIGRYTAGAIGSIAFNQPAAILDGNVIRVLTRVFGIRDDPHDKATNEKLWQLAGQLVAHAAPFPNSKLKTKNLKLYLSGPCSALNQSLMELGATVCTPKQPRCAACPLRRHCVALRSGLVGQLPNLRRRAPATARRFVVLVIEKNGCWFVRQRPAGVVNARLWEFPNFEVSADKPRSRRREETDLCNPPPNPPPHVGGYRLTPIQSACEIFGLGSLPGSIRVERLPLFRLRHTITRYRMTLEVHRAKMIGPVKTGNAIGCWRRFAALEKLAFTSAHRKIIRRLRAGQKTA